MTRFFLASHGHLASGLASSIQILTGDSSRLRVFDAYVDERSLEEELEAIRIVELEENPAEDEELF